MLGSSSSGMTTTVNCVLQLLYSNNAEIAGTLYMGEGTVRNHISAILQKLQLRNRTQIAVMCYRG